MKRISLFSALGGILASAVVASAHILFLTANSSNIRISYNSGGMVWSNFVTGGTTFRGIDVDPNNQIVYALDAFNSAANITLYSYDINGTSISSATATNGGTGTVRPNLEYFDGYVFINTANSAARYQAIQVDSGGSFLQTTTWVASVHNWETIDMMAVRSTSGTSYLFAAGMSGTTNMRRYALGSQMLLSAAPGIPNSAQIISLTLGATTVHDFTFTPSGRLLVLGNNGIYVSAPNQFENTSISLSSAFPFSGGAGDPSTGDAGATIRELILLDNMIYVANTTHVFRYSFDDSTGTVSFQAAAAHGFNSTSIHLTGLVPEPSTVGLFGLSLAALALIRRRAMR